MHLRKGKTSYPFQSYAQILKIMLLGVIILSLIFILNQIKLSHYFPIRTVKVYGANRINHQEVQALVQPLVGQGFFGINIEYIRDRLLQIPWVSDIFVRRDWPDQIAITIIEKNAVARWNQEHLLSSAGEIFLA